MARTTNRLTARAVQTLTKPGRHADGNGLYLSVDAEARRRWVLLYRRDGKLKELGLGSARDVTLADARKLAEDARQALRNGVDPIEAKRKPAETVPTFGAFADDLVESLEEGFRNEKHRYQWRQTLGDAYCKAIRSRLVSEIETEHVLSVLKGIWSTKPETASRLRGRIERVLAAATARGYRSGPNPAAWRGHLASLLPKRQKLTRGHHPAMPFDQISNFIKALRQPPVAGSALALEFLVYTAARTGEVLGATWAEIDLAAKVWTVPASRMKGGAEHRVPLTDRAIEILETVRMLPGADEPGAYVFPGARPKRPLSNMSLKQLLVRMDITDIVPHGFRSSFRDWAGEMTSFPREVAEAALAHVVGDETERAYRRGDALEKRRELMAAWAAYITPKPAAAVVSIRGRKRASR